MYKKIIFSLIFYLPLISMEHKDEWTRITAFADTPTKNTLAKVCKTLQTISSKNNLELYRYSSANLSKKQKQYALYYALYRNQPDIVKNLCDLGADIKEPFLEKPPHCLQFDKSTYNALGTFLAPAYFGDTEILEKNLNIAHGLFDSKTGISALQLATSSGHTAAVELLLTHTSVKKFINLSNGKSISPLCSAALFGQYHMTTLLFKHPHINLSLYDKNNALTPLYCACQNGHEEVVQFFIQHKPEWLNKCYKTYTPLYIASQNGHPHIMKIILVHSPQQLNQLTEKGSFPLYVASQNGHHEAVELLCKYGAPKNMLFDEQSPLLIASCNNHPLVVQTLLNYRDTKVNYKTTKGTALSISSELNHIDVVKLLLDRKDTDLTIDIDGNKPLHIAAKKNNVAVVQLLLHSNPGLINMINKEGDTALHLAVMHQNIATITLLLGSTKILVDIINLSNQTPLDCAITAKNQTIIQLLKQYGAQTYQEIYALE